MASRNISNIIDFYRYIVRKERGVFVTTDQICANLDAGQMDCFEDYFRQYGQTQEIHDAVKPFRVYQPFTTDAAGIITFPSDYLHLLGTIFTVSGSTVNEVTLYNEDEFLRALNSQLRPVSLSNPIGRDTATGISLFPQSQQTGAYTYLKRPPTPVYGYTQVGRAITYNPATSTQLGWSDAYINNIIARSLFYAGVNMDEQGVTQFAQQYTEETK